MPKACKVVMPTGNGDEVVQVPLIALMHHHTLQLQETRVKLNVKTDLQNENLNVEIGAIPSGANGQGQDEHMHQIELVFKSTAPSEGVSRIHQEANKFL